jgi:hypothetical protein
MAGLVGQVGGHCVRGIDSNKILAWNSEHNKWAVHENELLMCVSIYMSETSCTLACVPCDDDSNFPAHQR